LARKPGGRKMLLIDGVKYDLWTPSTEDEFERVVKEHAQEIFGEESIYFDIKQKLKSGSGIGSIPDGYVIVFGDSPEWHIIEVELSSHPLYEHIVSQVSKFINGISNPNIQRGIVNAIDGELTRNFFLRWMLKKAVEPTEIYRFLSDLISKQPVLTIIIEKDTEELREALSTLRYPQIKVVEFQTFVREGAEAVHAHLFEPLYEGKKVGERKVGWKGEGYTLVYVEGDYEVYEKGGQFSIEKLPSRKVVEQRLQSLEEAVGWIHGDKVGPPLRDTLEVTVRNPSYIKFHLFGIPKPRRRFFPGYKIPFELETDIGIIQTWCSSAPAGTEVGNLDKGAYIQANLADWYRRHPTIKVGDKVRFKVIEPTKKYRLEVLNK
jgi:hypothetical protein